MSPIPNDGYPTSIIPMILERIRSHLETSMILDVPEDSPTRALLVKVGRMQENPLNINVSLSILPGDFEDPAYMDGRIDNPAFNDLQIKFLPVGEIGGGEYWWRRGTVRIQTFFVRQRYDEQKAMEYAYEVYSRLLYELSQVNLSGLSDDFGEGCWPPIYVESSTFFESGGKDQFIWRGKVRWRVLTWRP